MQRTKSHSHKKRGTPHLHRHTVSIVFAAEGAVLECYCKMFSSFLQVVDEVVTMGKHHNFLLL